VPHRTGATGQPLTFTLVRYGPEENTAGNSQEDYVIARIWRGWAPLATADDYQWHYQTEVTEHLRAVSGFRGARLLRHDEGDDVMFTSITFFTSLDAVRGFAGDEYELAVVEDAAQQALSRWDEQVSHHEVVAELE
jgi:heme-degrading monooxygenase HmoA